MARDTTALPSRTWQAPRSTSIGATRTAWTHRSPTSAPRSLPTECGLSRSSSRCTRRDASNMSGVPPWSASRHDRRGAGLRPRRPPPRPAVRRPRLGHRAGRRRGAPRRPGRDRHHEDEPGAVESTPRPRGRRGWSRASSTSTCRKAVRPLRPALRARPVEPAVLLDRRQRRHELRWPALPRLRRHQHPRPRRRGRAARRRGDGARRPRPRAARASTCGARSSAARARSASPPDRGAPHARTRRRCAPCCSTSPSVDDGAATVSAIIAAGIVPAAIEMMDARITRAVEDFVHAGFPIDAAAMLIVEVDGLPDGRGRGRRAGERDRVAPTAPARCGSPPTTPSGR